jgi:ankyrin repeat domain-containing protein 50
MEELQRDCISNQDIIGVLQRCPTSVEGLYREKWRRICTQGEHYATLARLALLWVFHVEHEMSIEELRYAVAASSDPTLSFEAKRLVPEALLVESCCGLLAIDEKSRIVRLIRAYPFFLLLGYSIRS